MIIKKKNHTVYLVALLITGFSYANDTIQKEVYSYQSNSGTPVFTDKRPIKTKQYSTQTIETANPTINNQVNNSYITTNNIQRTTINHNQTAIYSHSNKKRSRKTRDKGSLKRCQRYKEKFDYYSEKMRDGYRSSEYKRLEKNRKKYKNLLFNRCDTKTFKE